MGHQITEHAVDPESRRRFVRRVLVDLQAIERMIEEDRFETGRRRIGAEQELVLVDASGRPAPVAMEVLERLPDAGFTTELARFNLEFNLDPLPFGDDCFSRLEDDIDRSLEQVREAARALGAYPVLTGILPTLRKTDLELDNITPRPRYRQLVDALREARGEDYQFRFTGPDELVMRHESVMLEACNTSTQFHLQVAPDEFARMYNIAQLVAAPVLAVGVNSPLLFGRRLWRETRIALFQQSIDTRRLDYGLEGRSGRVWFGESWCEHSVIELYRQDIARFRALLAEIDEEDPHAVLDAGGVPKLHALQLHNGTVYRWNRPCYGVTDGKPHLRIENRVLPSGPTVVDEVANAAFWYGLMIGAAEHYGDVSKQMEFDEARSNFQLAARLGLDTQLVWIDGWSIPVTELVRNTLLPLATDGLVASGVRAADIDRYLGIIRERVRRRCTGARWMIESLKVGRGRRTPGERLQKLVNGSRVRQEEGAPVHEWELINDDEADEWIAGYQRVDDFMTTDVFTVRDEDVVDLAASVMDWKHVRHVPVEDADHNLVGLLSYRQLLRALAGSPVGRTVPVKDVMQRDPITISPETSTIEAMRVMRDNNVPCLPVIKANRLVGILTERDFLPIAARLLEAKLKKT